MKRALILTILIFTAFILQAEEVSYTDYSSGDPLTADGMNNRFTTLYTLVNGNLDSANIEDGSIATIDLANDAVTNTKLASDPDSLYNVSGGIMTSAGVNIGIGTTEPDVLLDVNRVDSTTTFTHNYGEIRISDSHPQLDLIDSDGADWAIHVNTDKLHFLTEPWNVTMTLLGQNVGIGTTSPETRLTIDGGTDLNLTGGSYLQIGPLSGMNLGMDVNEIQARVNGAANQLQLQPEGGGLRINNISGKTFIFTEEGEMGIKTTTPGYTLDVNGHIRCTGWSSDSDLRFKKEIQPITPVLSKIKDIEGVSFTWDREDFPEKQFSEGEQFGLIAQDLEAVFPELVSTDSNGYKSVYYSKFTVVLLQAVKEQQEEIEELKAMILELSDAINEDGVQP